MRAAELSLRFFKVYFLVKTTFLSLEKEKIKQTEELIKQYGKMEQSTDDALASNMTLTQAQIDNAKLAADKIIEELPENLGSVKGLKIPFWNECNH